MTEDLVPEGVNPELKLVLRLFGGTRGGALATYLEDRAKARAEQAVTWAEDLAVSVELGGVVELLDRVGTDPRLDQAFARALDAVALAQFEAKADALASVLRAGIADDALVDETWLMVDTISRLEPPHVKALAVLAAPEDGSLTIASRKQEYPIPQNVRRPEMLKRLPAAPLLVDRIMQTLEAEGLAIGKGGGRWKIYDDGQTRNATSGPTEWCATHYGLRIHDHLAGRGEAAGGQETTQNVED